VVFRIHADMHCGCPQLCPLSPCVRVLHSRRPSIFPNLHARRALSPSVALP
jgi:hypothetical protein